MFFDIQKDPIETNGAVSKGKTFFNELNQLSGSSNSSTNTRNNYKHEIIVLSDSDDTDAGSNSEIELLPDVEDALVVTALARIRRAKEKGKKDVNLSKGELAALANRRKLKQAAAAANSERTKKPRGIAVPLSSSIISDQDETFSQNENILSNIRTIEPSPNPSLINGINSAIFPTPDGGAVYAPLGVHPQQSGSVVSFSHMSDTVSHSSSSSCIPRSSPYDVNWPAANCDNSISQAYSLENQPLYDATHPSHLPYFDTCSRYGQQISVEPPNPSDLHPRPIPHSFYSFDSGGRHQNYCDDRGTIVNNLSEVGEEFDQNSATMTRRPGRGHKFNV